MKAEEEQWLQHELITQEQFNRIDDIRSARHFSIYHELQSVLYLGLLLFTAGAGLLVYTHIGRLGHLLAVAALVGLTAASLLYIHRRARPYSHDKQEPVNGFFDYVTLGSALLTAIVFTYLEVQFGFFGSAWSWLPLVSAAAYVYMAYRFDHSGVLGMAVTALGSFLGLQIEPDILNPAVLFRGVPYYHTGMAYALFLLAVGTVLHRNGIKPHFTPLYRHFSAVLLSLSALSAMFDGEFSTLYTLLALAVGGLWAAYAVRTSSFWFLLFGGFTFYIALTTLIVRLGLDDFGESFVVLLSIYFTVSPAALIGLFIYFKKRFK